MSEAKKPAIKHIIDVARPGTSAPPATSKSIIVTNRPILKDPMVSDLTDQAGDKSEEKAIAKAGTTKVAPIGAPPLKKSPVPTKDKAIDVADTTDSDKPAEAETTNASKTQPETKRPEESPETAKPKKSEETTDETASADKKVDDQPQTPADQTTDEETETTDKDEKASAAKTQEKLEAEAAQQFAHDAAIQKLIDAKKFSLPINAIEKRKSKRFVLLGVVLSILLALAWADIALDAGLVQMNGIKPLTHFFSN